MDPSQKNGHKIQKRLAGWHGAHCEFAARIIYLFTSLLNLLLGLYLYFVFPRTVILLHQLKFTRTNFYSVMPLLFYKGCRNQTD